MQGNEPQDNLDARQRELITAKRLCNEGDWEQGYDIAYQWLKSDPNDPVALNLVCWMLLNTGKVAIAYPMLKHLTTLAPDDPVTWLNMGMASADLWQYNESVRAYKKGISFCTDAAQESSLCVNMASVMVDHGEFEDAQPYCERAIELQPDSTKGKANLGFCQLAQKNWDGWKNYRHCVGENGRYVTQYNEEPLWEGEKGKICVYGEQGLGDEISFSQMLPDMQKWCDENGSQLVVDMQPRLESLMRRSFPDIEIHGTRGENRITWDPRDIDYSLPIAQLGEYFRTKDEDFNGEPYLTADPDRVLQWKALFDAKRYEDVECGACGCKSMTIPDDGDSVCTVCYSPEPNVKPRKPVIGIAWRGGIWKTAAKYRQLDLEQLLPVLKSVDAHWVSLQYKDSTDEIEAFKENHPEIDLVEYPHCTLSNDFDDTVAMIAAMDQVVCMQTTVVHVAGSLGVPCWTFVPKSSQWRYGQKGEDFPWANSVRIIRQAERGQWADIMEKTGEELANYTRVSKAAGNATPEQEDQLRHDSGEVRRNRGANDRLNGDRPPA